MRSGVSMRRGRRVEISSDAAMLCDMDGEQVGTTPARITCLHRAMTFCVARGDRAAGGA